MLGDDTVEGVGSVETIVRDDAQLRERLQRIEALDAAVKRTYADVPVPAGLSSRLLAALAADATVAAAVSDAAQTTAVVSSNSELASPATVERASGVEPSPRSVWSRRQWLTTTGAAAGATAAGLAFALWLYDRGQRDLTLDDVLRQALVFHQARDARLKPPQPTWQFPAPQEFPLSTLVSVAPAATRWTALDGRLLGRPGVAYELASPRSPSATLYVLQFGKLGEPDIESLPAAPAQSPHTTGGFALAAWREEDRICILVVEGDEREYRRYLRHVSGDLA